MKISLKDIDVKKIIGFLKRKETIIAIFVIIFIIGIFIVGNLLIEDYLVAIDERDFSKSKYERIMSLDTDTESLKKKIEEANNESEEILNTLSELDRKQVAEFLIKIQKETGITWDDGNRKFTVKNSIKDAEELRGILVTISKFYGSYEDIKNFFDYIKQYERKVTIDSLNFSKDQLTGKMTGSMSLMFYMRNDKATQEEK